MAELADLVKRLEAVTVRLEKCGAGRGAAGGAADDDDDFDTLETITEFQAVTDAANALVKASENLPKEVGDICSMLGAVCKAELQFLRIAARAKACMPADLQPILKPLSDAMGAISEFRDKNRPSKCFNHLSAVSEAVPAFGWVAVAPRPLDYMGEMIGAADFYINRVLKDYKETPGHKEWTMSLRALFTALKNYVTNNHKKGTVWNHNGGDAKAVAAKLSGGAPKGAAPPAPSVKAPPPPPPAPKPIAGAGPGTAKPAAPSSAGLFAELNKGSDITKGLKKVDRSQMTHKNPELRGSSVVRDEDVNKNKAKPSPVAAKAAVKKAPVLQLVGKKWNIEYQSGNQAMEIECQPHHAVYVFKCENSVLTVKGKVNSITLDGCKKTAVIVDTMIASMDVVNCQSCKVQVNDKAPIINIDKTDGCQVFVQKKSGLNTEFVTAKSSEVNICVIEDNGEYTEAFVAEQFKTTWQNGKFVTELAEVCG